MNKRRTVFVGLSGGVDSSVAALRLKQRGFNVVGVFIKVWHPDFMICNWEAERLDAMRVAAHLDIPFLTCDAEATYRDAVAHYFIEEYKAGRTPNPDVLCNKEVKFGVFLEFAKARGADYIATGHYARKIERESGSELHRGVDTNKDQSYFLWSLSAEQLAAALFPVGDTPKELIRKEAAQAKIPTAIKKDSQGVCFLGHIDIPDFIAHYTDLHEGSVLDTSGNIIGTHKSALVYTLGQRHGFTLTDRNTERTQHYVVAKDLERNTITVSDTPPTATVDDHFTLSEVVLRSSLTVGASYEAQFRYRQTPFPIEVLHVHERTVVIKPLRSTDRPAAGQSCVIYQGSHCLGGGMLV